MPFQKGDHSKKKKKYHRCGTFIQVGKGWQQVSYKFGLKRTDQIPDIFVLFLKKNEKKMIQARETLLLCDFFLQPVIIRELFADKINFYKIHKITVHLLQELFR